MFEPCQRSITAPPPGIEWRDMESAPKDGTVIAVRFHLWNRQDHQVGVQAVQWLKGAWRTPFDPDSAAYADAWADALEVTRGMEAGDA